MEMYIMRNKILNGTTSIDFNLIFDKKQNNDYQA